MQRGASTVDARARVRMCAFGRCVGVVLSLASPSAQSAPPDPGIELVWHAPPECPSDAAFRDQITHYLGQSLTIPRSQSLEAEVSIEQGAAAWEMTLEIRTPDGASSTRIQGRDCTTLAHIAAVKVAMAIDPLAVVERLLQVEEAASSPPAAATPDEPSPGEPSPALPPAPRETPAPSIQLGLRTLSGIAWGALPEPGPLFAWAGSVLGRNWRVDLGGLFWAPQEVVLDDTGAGGRIRALGGYVDGCWVPRAGRFAVPICGGFELASMHGRGVGVEPARSARRLWGAGRVSTALVWSPHPVVGLVLQPSASAAFFRPDFALADGRHVHRARVFDLRVAAGLEVRFGVPRGSTGVARRRKQVEVERIRTVP